MTSTLLVRRAAPRIIQARARLWRVEMPRCERKIRRWAKGQRDQLLKAMGAKATDPVAELGRILDSVDWATETDRLLEILGGFHYSMTKGAADHLDMLGVEVEFGGRGDPAVERILAAILHRPDGPRLVPGRVRRAVQDEIMGGLAQGLTFSQIGAGGTYTVRGEQVDVQGVAGVYRQLEGWQGTRIARTEAGVGYNRSSAGLMRDAGVQHVDIVDGTDDEECAAANGSRWTVDEYDSDPIAHPNCTRIGLPVIG